MVLALLAVAALLAANGIFAAAEFSIAKARRSRLAVLAERGKRLARIVHQAAGDPEAFVAATQLGITMTSLGIGWLGAPAVARAIAPLLQLLPAAWQPGALFTISAALAFAVITTLHIILGELVPKSIALRNAEQVALVVVPPTIVFSRVFRPFIWSLDFLADRTLRLFGMTAEHGRHVAFDRDELVMLVGESRRAGVVEDEEESLVRRVFRLTDRVAGDIMVHRTAVVGVPRTATVRDAVAVVRERGFSRLPVFGATPEEIVGAVRAKDLLLELAARGGDAPLEPIVRPVLYVPETKPVVELLEEMRHGHSQLAVVLEEYGSTAGIVTLEDVLEEIVGEIPGESRPQRTQIFLAQPDRIVVDATIDLPTLNDIFGIALDTEKATTLGGFIFHRLGRIPEAGERFTAAGLVFTIESVVGRRIGRVEIRKLPRS
ncbi:MAG TPA: hemolysin family protein [bacterium]|nr:hemolysin family protein [bacterium]